ncbi:MAG: protein kinase [Planctomycetaceae bacterium]
MGDDPAPSMSDDSSVDAIIAEILESFERGEEIDPQQWKSRYPAFAKEVALFFEGYSHLKRFAPREPDQQHSPASSPSDFDTPTFLLSDTKLRSPSGLRIRYLGDYELQSEVARGGMGVVFKARQTSLNRIVALKMILAGTFASDEEVKRFYLEAEAAAQLDHPGIVPIYEVGQYEGHHYFSMGFVDGTSLASRLMNGPLPPLEAAELVRQVAEAVQYAHSKGVIHRDLKPGNILIDQKGVPRVTDFGLAKRLESGSELTGTGQVLGTPSYMPPEQAAGQMSAVGPLSDVYSLGAILFCTLTGRPPFQSANPIDTLLQVQRQEPVSLRSLNEKIPTDLETIALKCLDKSPARRYASAQDLADELNRFLGGHPIQARPVGRIERLWRWALRNQAVASLLLLVVVTLVSGTIISSFYAARATAHAFDLAEETKRANSHAKSEKENAIKAEMNARLANENAQREREQRIRADNNAELEKQQRDRADKREREARRGLYASHMNLAQAAWENGQVGRVLQLLAMHGPGTASDEFRSVEWHYWKRLCHADRLTLDVPRGMCNVAYSPDGKRIASAGIWDEKPAIKVWEVATGRELMSIDAGHGTRFVAFHPSKEQLASTGYGKKTVIWNLITGQPVRELKGEPFIGACLAYSTDGSKLIVGGSNIKSPGTSAVAKLWDSESGSTLRSFEGHSGEITSVAISPNEKWIATVGILDHQVKIWDATSGVELRTLRRSSPATLNHATGGVAFSPNGALIAAGMGKGVVLWDATNDLELRSIPLDGGFVTSVVFSPDGSEVAASTYDQTIEVCKVSNGESVRKFLGHTEIVTSVVFSPDGRNIATSSSDGTVKFWDRDDQSHETLSTVFGLQRSVSFSPDGSLVAGASHEHWVNVIDTVTRRSFRTLYGHTGYVRGIAWSPRGNQIVTGADDATVIVWDVLSAARIAILKGHSKPVNGVAFSPNADYVASAGDDNLVILWGVAAQQAKWTFRGHSKQVNSVAFSPDGHLLLSAGRDGLAKVWSVATGEVVADLKGHSGDVTCAVFSPDGHHIVSAGRDKTAKVWDSATGSLTMTISGHTKSLDGVAFSPDGRRIVTTSDDQTVKFFDAIGGHETLALKKSNAQSVAFSSDGGRMALGGGAGPLTGALVDLRPLPGDVGHEQKAKLLLEMHVASAQSLDDLVEMVKSDSQFSDEIRKVAIRLSSECWQRQIVGPAQRSVGKLFGEGLLTDEVIARINGDNSLTPPMREAAVKHVRFNEGDIIALTSSCWQTLRRKNATAEEYQRALRQAELVRRISPGKARIDLAIGVAQLRCGEFEAALKTLNDRNASSGKKSPDEVSYLAMALHRAGQPDAARTVLQEAKRLTEKFVSSSMTIPESKRIFTEVLQEAQELIQANDGRSEKTLKPDVSIEQQLTRNLERLKADVSNAQLWRETGHLQGRAGRFELAAASLQRCWELNPDDHIARFAAASALSSSTELRDRYRTLCTESLKVFQESRSYYQCEMTAKLCTFSPNAVEDYEPVLRMIDRAIALDTKLEITAWTTLTKAEVLLRMKRFAETVALTDECLAKHIAQQRGRLYYETQVRYVRCLALRGIGRVDEAQKELTLADAMYSTNAPKLPDLGDHWIDWQFCSHLKTEVQRRGISQ